MARDSHVRRVSRSESFENRAAIEGESVGQTGHFLGVDLRLAE